MYQIKYLFLLTTPDWLLEKEKIYHLPQMWWIGYLPSSIEGLIPTTPMLLFGSCWRYGGRSEGEGLEGGEIRFPVEEDEG